MNRRELLGGLGIASAGTLLAAFGCGGRQQQVTAEAKAKTAEVRALLREAVGRLAASFATVHVLGVSRRHTIAAVDVLGHGVAHAHREAAVLAVRDRDGAREVVTSDLSPAGIAAATRQLIGTSKQQAPIAIPRVPVASSGGGYDEVALRKRVEDIAALERPESRVVYAAAMIELDDATVWSLSQDHDREQRLVRMREHVMRAAWHGAKPVIGEVHRAWLGAGGQGLDAAAVAVATRRVLELLTPGQFVERKTAVLIDPSVAATLVDATVRALRRRVAVGTQLASPLLTLVDDPTVRGAYGGFAFDDAGVVAQRIALVEAGKLARTLGAGRTSRAGYVGPVEYGPSHLVVARGTQPHDALLDEGFHLEGGMTAVIDPISSRIAIGAARAREIKGGKPTGRVYSDVELVGELQAVLASVSAVSANTATFGYRDVQDGEPRWRSIEAPWLRIEGFVRRRR